MLAAEILIDLRGVEDQIQVLSIQIPLVACETSKYLNAKFPVVDLPLSKTIEKVRLFDLLFLEKRHPNAV